MNRVTGNPLSVFSRCSPAIPTLPSFACRRCIICVCALPSVSPPWLA